MNAMQNTWTPYRNDLMNKKDGFKIINVSTTYFFMIMSIVSIIVSSLSKDSILVPNISIEKYVSGKGLEDLYL